MCCFNDIVCKSSNTVTVCQVCMKIQRQQRIFEMRRSAIYKELAGKPNMQFARQCVISIDLRPSRYNEQQFYTKRIFIASIKNILIQINRTRYACT